MLTANSARLLVYWLYHRTLPDIKTECSEKQDLEYDHECLVNLANLQVLADQVLMPDLQNAATKVIIDLAGTTIMRATLLREICSIAPRPSMPRNIFLVATNFDLHRGSLSRK